MSFPNSTDTFPDLYSRTTIEAGYVNTYQSALTKTQIEVSSILSRIDVSSTKMVGFCWRVQISIVPWNDTLGYGFQDGYAQTLNNSQKTRYGTSYWDDVVYRWKRPREPFQVDNRENGTLGSYMPPYSSVVLEIPTGVVLPNSLPFHANNRHFVTVESSKEQITANNIPKGRNPWSINFESAERNVGGYIAREGILYYTGTGDYNPRVVLADWFPSQDDWNDDKTKRGELLTALVHMVIIG